MQVDTCPTAGLNGHTVPEEKQAHFQQTYTVLITFLNLVLPPVITQGLDEVSTTDHEAALGTRILTNYMPYSLCTLQACCRSKHICVSTHTGTNEFGPESNSMCLLPYTSRGVYV